MTPEVLRERLARLRECGAALRRRPADEVLELLGGLLEAWREPAGAWRAALEMELPAATGFSHQSVREGLRLALEPWTAAALRSLAREELGGSAASARGFDVTGVLLAGSIPMPTLLSLLTPLLLRSPVLAKCAARDPVTPRLLARSLAELDAGLGACLEVCDFRSDDEKCVAALLEADCVVATGCDATIDSVRGQLAAGRRFVGYGHRLSLAALGTEALAPAALTEVAARVALDVALWDQLGCLSPIEVYVIGESAADAAAEALADALAGLERRMPRGRPDTRAAVAIHHERAEAELRGAADARTRLLASSDTAWTVVREAAPALRPAPLHRFVRVVPVHDVADLLQALAPYARHLAGVALEGFGRQGPALDAALRQLDARPRTCAPGELQAPPLSWPRGADGVLRPLLRFTEENPPG